MALSSSRARVSSSSSTQRQHNNNNIPVNGRISSPSRSFDGGGAGGGQRPRAPSTRRSLTPTPPIRSLHHDSEPGRVRVAVRVRPKNAEELASDVDFADCVELQPELKRLKLKKNNWNSDSYRFDEVFSESASQRRVYEVVAKPVVESVLSGYNGTVMAYGQTGTGKTYTLGRLGKDDASERGIMVRAMEDILASVFPAFDSIEVSYLQLYLESVQDLLAPEKTNIPIAEDPKTGEVTLPGAVVVKIRDLDQFLELLQSGEANRHAANTMMNTESSRSHAILMVHIRRSVRDNENFDTMSQKKDSESNSTDGRGVSTVRKSKLLIVDLAGSERIDKSGSKGHMLEEAKFINLSLTSLGKCINALAENSPHVPTRDSKLTRLLRDSFGGSARTSLIITIGPSARHHGETTSTVMFGQRAMKIVNMLKLKEEFDYEGLCRNLENEVEHLNVEIDRQQKLRDDDKIEMERKLTEYQKSFAEAENCLLARSEFLEKENAQLEREVKDMVTKLDHLKEDNEFLHGEVARLEMSLNQSKQCQNASSTYQKILADTTQMYEKKIADVTQKLEEEEAHSASAQKELEKIRALLSDRERSLEHYQTESSSYQKALADTTQMYEKKMSELIQELDDMRSSFEGVEEELNTTKKQLIDHHNLKQMQGQTEIDKVKVELDESHQLLQKSVKELELLKSEHRFLSAEKMQGQIEIDKVKVELDEIHQLLQESVKELELLKSEHRFLSAEKVTLSEEVSALREKLFVEEKQRKAVETELHKLKKIVPESDDNFEDKKPYMKENIAKPLGLHKSNQLRETTLGQRTTIAKYCEEVGLEKILKSLTSGDIDVQIHAVKLVANLAAEDINQEKIVEEGGLDALLMLLQSSQNTTVLRVASGAIANLAMNEINQTLIVSKGGAQLLANTASKTNDPQTLRMVAGAIANLCGNVKLHFMLIEDGATKALLGMARSGNSEVIAQVARGIANFAKCESRGIIQGHKKGRSKLMEDGALTWLIANSSMASSSIRRHIELALCHLAQNEENARDFITSGGEEELARISIESTTEDIRILAKKALKQFPVKAERV